MILARRLALILIAFTLAGCSSFQRHAARDQARVDKAKDRINGNHEAQFAEAIKHVYASGLALNLAEPTPPVKVACDFNSMAQLVLGPPDVKSAVELQTLVTGLLSTNKTIRLDAEKQRDRMNQTLVGLQEENSSLQARLEKSERLRDAGYVKAAEEASKYQKWKRRLYWALGIIGGGFLLMLILPALAVAFPPLAPFGAMAVSTGATVARSIFRVAPKAMNAAGVVGRGAYELSEGALRDVVSAIKTVKEKKRDVFDEHLKPVLLDKTNRDTSREKIRQVETACL